MRDFGLEVFFSQWEFTAKHHMTASDIESRTVSDLLAYAGDEGRAGFQSLSLGYTETWGAPALRELIAGTYDRISAEQVLCLAGAGEGLYAVARTLLAADDHAIVTTPNYQSAETVPLSMCAVSGVAQRQTRQRGGWRIDIDEIRDAIRPNTRLMSLNLPNNPTGMLVPPDDFSALIDLCRAHGIYLLCDEVYRGVELNSADRLPQVADVYEKGISLNVMSKAYGLPGLRLGWIACQDRDVLERVERYKHYLSICNSAPSEYLAQIALKARDSILENNRALLRRNVDLLESFFSGYPELVEWTKPLGGCVAFPRFAGPEGGEAFCRSLIEESGILLLPSSIYRSEVNATPADHFRIGFGRDGVFLAGLEAMRRHFEIHYREFRR